MNDNDHLCHQPQLAAGGVRDGAVSAAYAIHRICFVSLFTIYITILNFAAKGLVSPGRKFRDESIESLAAFFRFVRLIMNFGELSANFIASK